MPPITYSSVVATPIDGKYNLGDLPPCNGGIIVNASARPPRLAGLPTVGTCNYRYTGI